MDESETTQADSEVVPEGTTHQHHLANCYGCNEVLPGRSGMIENDATITVELVVHGNRYAQTIKGSFLFCGKCVKYFNRDHPHQSPEIAVYRAITESFPVQMQEGVFSCEE